MDKQINRLTVAQKAQLLKLAKAARLRTTGTLLEEIDRQPATGPQPASLAQQRLWFLDQLERESTIAYQLMGSLALRDPVDVPALHRALHALLARHEALRTVFAAVDGQAMATILAALDVPLPVDDLRSLDDAPRQAALARATAQEVEARFDLARGPLLRVRLVLLGPDTHLFLFKLHHIVSDGWSLLLFARELEALYAICRQGIEPTLPALPVQYADYARWQHRWLQAPARDAQAQAWSTRLTDAPTLLQLPLDHPRPAARSYRGGGSELVLDPALTQRLKALAAARGMTLFMVLYSAFAVLLSRLSGQTTVVIGTPMANRQRTELEGLIGLFVNTLPLPLHVEGTLTVEGLLQQARRMILDAYDHQEIPFDRIVEALQPARSLNHHPVFQAMIALQNMPRSETQDAATGLVPQNGAQFDLSLGMVEWGDHILGTMNYARDLFDEDTIARWTSAYETVLRQIVRDPQGRVDAVTLLDARSRREVVETFNATERAYAGVELVHAGFEAQAARTPDAIAAMDEDGQVSYAELNRRANRLARYLRTCGVGPEGRVAVSVARGVPLVVCLLATLKAGGAYVPLDPGYPPARLAEMLADSRPAVVLQASGTEVPVTAAGSARCVWVDRDAQRWSGLSGADLEAEGLTPAHLAYVIYTSGSTGRPKGVMNAHRGVANRLRWMQEAYGLRAGEAVLQKTPCSFDVSVWEFYWPLLAGAKLVLARAEGHRDPGYLREVIEQEGIGTLHFVPSMLGAFLQEVSGGCGSLVRVFCSGEALPRAAVERFAAQWPQVGLHNLYGPTEAAVDVTAYACAGLPAQGEVPIGAPIANVRIYVLDGRGEPVPVGVSGEVHIGGVAVARGYWSRPALTAERFVADGCGVEAGARLYRTGDLGRWRKDGTIEYLGRNDDQVKLRGYRIELGEIEARLREHAQVREAAVVMRDDGAQARLVGYVTGFDAQAPEVDALRAHLQARLPGYMVPSVLVVLEAMPLAPNGKLDRRALPMPEGQAHPGRRYEAPRGEREQALAQIWQELLKVPRVGRHDHFFDLGGHSLLAIQLVSRVRHVFGHELALRTVFASPTLAELNEALLASSTGTLLEEIDRQPATGPQPASLAQQRLWFLDQLERESTIAYQLMGSLALRDPVDVPALHRALHALLARHEALRTVFAAVDGQAMATILAALDVPLPVDDLRSLDDAPRQAALARATAQEVEARFDLARGPLLRVRLVLLGPDTHLFLFKLHHIVSDGWSLLLFARELEALYAICRQGIEPTLPALPVQYADYARWQHRWLQAPARDAQAQAWSTRLTDAPTLLQLPLDHPRPAARSYRGGGSELVLDPALTQRLKALAAARGMTLFMVLYSAFAVLLSRLSGQTTVVIGTPMANRQRTELEGLIGLFVNTLPLPLHVEGTLTVEGLLQQARRMILDAYDHQEIPFDRIVEALQPARSLNHHPVFQAMIALQNMPRSETQDAATGLVPQNGAQFDLSLGMVEWGDHILGTMNYARDLFDEDTIARWTSAYETVLRQIVRDPQGRVDAVTLLDARSRREVVETFNATERAYAGVELVHAGFEAQAARTPDAIAAMDEDGQVSYAELNRRANRLARYLRTCGVGPEGRVAVSVARGVPLVVCLLATLKAGGAYVPLDPGYPPARLAEMLADSRPAVVLQASGTEVPVTAAGSARCVWVDRDAQRWSGLSGADLEAEGLTPAHLAYVIYTSGSTGRPKGVMNAHRGVANRLRWMQEAYGLRAGEAVLQKTPCSFDVSVWEFYWPLLAGAKLVLARAEGHRDPGYLREVIEQEGIGTLHFVPSMLGAFLQEVSGGCGSLVRVFCSGEALPRAAVERFAAQWPQVGLHNLYGPTEAAVDVTAYACAGLPAQGEVPIGAPIANVRIYVLDGRGEPVPVGVSGEVHIGGVAVARGYWLRPALTAERFVADGCGVEAGARLYRTGDLGRWRKDGTIEYLGRNDDQVKLRGYRIELGEIEARLREHAQVREAAVVMRDDGAQARLVGYVTGFDAQAPEVDALRAHLQARLPGYMVPSVLVVLEAMPLAPNGKLDRRALPMPEGQAHPGRRYEAPQGEREQALAQIWQELLKVPRVGRHDHFFDLGGHSLLAIQLVSRVRHVFGHELALRTVFASPTLAELNEALAVTASAPQTHIPRADRNRPIPLSPIQQQLWRWECARNDHEHPALYCSGLRLCGTLDRRAFVAALDALVARHEILRTDIDTATDPDGPRQRIAAQARFPLTEFDLTDLAPDDRERRVLQLYRQFGSEPFDVSAGPLARVCLIRLDQTTHVLILALHRLICDAWSLEVLIREASVLYNAFKAGKDNPLPPLPIQFADYAVWYRDWLQGEILQKHIAYYTRHLEGAPMALTLPADRPAARHPSHLAASVNLSCGRKLSEDTLQLARTNGLTPSMVILAAYALLLMRLSRQDDVVIGMIVGNRPRAELETLIGPFAQAIAMRLRLEADMTVIGFLDAVREATLAGQSYQSLPAEKIFEAMNLEHRPIGAMFRFQNEPRSPLLLEGMSVGPQPDGPEGRPDILHVDVSLVVDQSPDQILANLHYSTDRIDRATAEAWRDRLYLVLTGMTEQMDRSIADWVF